MKTRPWKHYLYPVAQPYHSLELNELCREGNEKGWGEWVGVVNLSWRCRDSDIEVEGVWE